VSKAFRVKKHAVWDKEGKKHELEGSVETKGLLGTDGRKYILDLYRLTPLDIQWLDGYWSDSDGQATKPKECNYPHRMAVMRPELVEAYWRLKMGDYVREEVAKRRNNSEDANDSSKSDEAISDPANGNTNGREVTSSGTEAETAESGKEQERVDISAFSLTLNPDVFCGQVPQTEEEKEEWSNDEQAVKAVCEHLHQRIMPELVSLDVSTRLYIC